MEKSKTNRTYKSRIFEMIFNEREELLGLYNAVNGTSYEDPELLEINTLENAIYMSMHNDISFIIDLRLNLYEHQSTYNPNLPLRFLLYIGDLLSEMTRRMNLYGSRMIPIPTPQFLVFYNGAEERPDREVMLLSSAFQVPDEDISLELKVVVLNINKGHNTQLLEACRTLQDYAEYTSRVRIYAEHMGIEDAIERAVTECIREGILSDFLSKNRAEAIKVSLYEYDYEEHMRMEREESREDGIKEGRLNMIRHAIENGATEEQLKSLLGVTEEELIKEGIWPDSLNKDRKTAKKVSIYEYDQEERLKMEREISREAGLQEGIQKGRQEGRQEGRLDMICHAIENGATEEQLKSFLGVTEEELETARKYIQI